MTEDETGEWHHQLKGHEFDQTVGDSEGQGSLACCSPWGHRVRHNLATEQQQQHNMHFFKKKIERACNFWLKGEFDSFPYVQ